MTEVNYASDMLARRGTGWATSTKFTPVRRKIIIDAIRNGEFGQSAAAKARINQSTLRVWLTRGEAAAERQEAGEDLSTEDTEYAQFYFDLMESEATIEGEIVGEVRKAGEEGNWIASMTFLERRFGNRWRKREAVEHTGANGGPIQTQAIDNSKSALAELLTVLKDAGVLPVGVTGITIPPPDDEGSDDDGIPR